MPEDLSMGHLAARAKLAGLVAHRGAEDPEIAEARRDLAAENLAAYIKRVVDSAPPLTPAQRERLALLLHPGAGDGT
jgi:hypothetical protein